MKMTLFSLVILLLSLNPSVATYSHQDLVKALYVRWKMVLYLKIGQKPFKHFGMGQLKFNEWHKKELLRG